MAKNKKEKFPSYADFSSQVRGNHYGSLYLFIGSEDLLIDECVQSIINDLLTTDTKAFNLDIVDGGKVSAKDVLAHAAAYPMMSARRIVIVKNFDELCGSEQSREIVGAYIQKPLESTCFVMIAEKPDFRTKPFNELKKKNVVYEFPQLYDNQVPGWIMSRCQSNGKEMDPDACRLLHAHVGNSLRVIHNELEKTFTFIGSRKHITADDILQVVGITKGNTVFDLQRAIGEKNLDGALTIIKRMLETGESPQGIIVMLTRYFTALWKTRDLRSHGTPEADIVNEIKVSPYFVKDYIAAAERFTPVHYESVFSSLLQTDLQLKSTSSDTVHVMELLVYALVKPELDAFKKLA